MNDVEIKSEWIAVKDKLPEEGKIVGTKIQPDFTSEYCWCLIKRVYSNGCWNVVNLDYVEFDQIKFNPTHWHYW